MKMSKKDEFKGFAKAHPELVKSIRSGDANWQQLYEIYDIYGDDERAWDKYLKKSSNTSSFNNITDIVKNIDMDSVQKHINTAQKALGLVQELTNKGSSSVGSIKAPVNPRPINKFFEDQLMQVSALMELKKKPKIFELLKYNSYWLKDLNRDPNNVRAFLSSMKVKYRMRATDKVSDAIDNIDIISNVLNALKQLKRKNELW